MAPANGPYVSGTTINSVAVNARFADEETELSDSLSRSGKGAMLASLRGVDGTVAAPAVSFVSEPASGLYRAGANDVRLAVGGADALKLTSGGIAGPLTFPSGSTAIQVTLAGGFLLLQGNQAAGQVSTIANPADVVVRPTAARTAGFIFQVQRNDGNGILGFDYQGLMQLQNPAAIQPASMWTALVPNTGWTAANGLGYWKDPAGVVRVKGAVTAPGASNQPFTLPVGFRSLADRWFPIMDLTAGVISFIKVASDGTTFLSPAVNTHQYFLDSIAFLAEA